jgi:hypothetical protein
MPSLSSRRQSIPYDDFLNTLYSGYNQIFPGKVEGILMVLNAQVEEYSKELENSYWDEGFVLQLSYDGQVKVGNWISISPGIYLFICTLCGIAEFSFSGDHIHIGIQRATTTLTKTFRTVAAPPCTLNPQMNVYPGE